MKPATHAAHARTLRYVLLALIPAVVPTAAVDAQDEIKINSRRLGAPAQHLQVVVPGRRLNLVETIFAQTLGVSVFLAGSVWLGRRIRHVSGKSEAAHASRISHLLFWVCVLLP